MWGHVLIQHFVWTCQKLSFRPSKICLEEMQEWCQQLVTFYNIRQTWPGNSYISTHPHRRPACGTNLQIHTYCCVCLIDFETLNSHKHHWNLTSVGGVFFFCRMSLRTWRTNSYFAWWMDVSWQKVGARTLKWMTQHKDLTKWFDCYQTGSFLGLINDFMWLDFGIRSLMIERSLHLYTYKIKATLGKSCAPVCDIKTSLACEDEDAGLLGCLEMTLLRFGLVAAEHMDAWWD